MRTYNKEFFVANAEQVTKLSKMFNCCDALVEKALNFDPNRGHSELAKRIRMAAYHMGCAKINALPEIETIHNANGKMIQCFPLGPTLIFDKKTGSCEMIHRGNAVKRWEKVQVSQIEEIQAEALSLSLI